ncbi:MAG: hypothetical protein KBD63_07385 [Bacteriovoracaceae bacterium]|nr:hypothetical protein [Bacteriovoracaceae bacterium]
MNSTPLKNIDPQKIKSINEALRLLDEVSKENVQEIKQMISADYKTLKKVFVDPAFEQNGAYNGMHGLGEDAIGYFSKLKDEALKLGRSSAKTVDKSIHESPWYFIGATTLLVGVASYYLGSRGKTKDS